MKYNDGSDHVITPSGGVYSFTMPSHAVTVSATFLVDTYNYFDARGDGTEASPYPISNSDDWNVLAANFPLFYACKITLFLTIPSIIVV